MKRTPNTDNCNLNRPRSKRRAQIHLMTVRQSPASEAQNANRPKVRKTPAQVAPKSYQTHVRKSKVKARLPSKSP